MNTFSRTCGVEAISNYPIFDPRVVGAEKNCLAGMGEADRGMVRSTRI